MTLRRARFRSRLLRAGAIALRQRDVRPSDALLVSYPRSGTTWLRFLLSVALTEQGAEFDARLAPIRYLGDHRGTPALLPRGGRIIYSHETAPTRAERIVYLVRDPRDVALSEHRWLQRRRLSGPDLDRFLMDFVQGRSNPWGAWDRHVETWLARQTSPPRIHVTTFEALHDDAAGVLAEVISFLGAGGVDEGRIQRAVSATTLEEMREREARAPSSAFAKGVDRRVGFVGGGKSQGWRESLTADQALMIGRRFGRSMQRLGYDLSVD
jgi:hypothetical protein